MLRSRALYVFVAAFTLFIAVFYHDSDVSFVLLYALVMLLLVSGFTAATAKRMVGVRMSVDRDTLFKDEALDCTVELRNRGVFLYPRLKCMFYHPEVLQYTGEDFGGVIAPRGKMRQQYQVRFPYRGVYNVGIQDVRATDFLGLFRIRIPVRQPRSVVVYPKTSRRFSLLMQEELQNTVFRYELFDEDVSSVADLRKYTASDSLRRIHWKLSAKRNELMVKNFQSFEPNHTLLFLDTFRLPLEKREKAEFEDRAVSYVSAAVHYFIRSRRSAEFLYGKHHRLRIDPEEELDKVLRILAEITFDSPKSRLKDCVKAMDEQPGSCNLVAFLSVLDREMHDTIKDILSLGHNVMVYFCYSETLPIPGDTQYLLESLRVAGAYVRETELVDENL